jgi:hypothetical protein
MRNLDGVVKSREFSIKLVGWAIAHHKWRAIARPRDLDEFPEPYQIYFLIIGTT